MTVTTLRNADLTGLAEVLKSQAAARYDVVVPSSKLELRDGNMIIKATTEPEITADGVTPAREVEVCLEPTKIFDEGIATRLDIPRAYFGRMRDKEVDLLDTNVNTWLARSDRAWFVRGFKGEGDECGTGRAFLSDRFGCIDNYDVLLSALEAIRDTGVDAKVVTSDLTERRMRVRVVVPEIMAMAPTLLNGYRSPYSTGGERGRLYDALGHLPNGEPIVFAGFIIANSETGNGAFTVTPQITALACFNGMTFTKDVLRRTHLGSQMDEGQIEWSNETRVKHVELIKSQVKDMVSTICSPEFVAEKVAEVERDAGKEISRPADVIKEVSKVLKFTEEEADGILGHFITGGQSTAGGVLNAVTSFAQKVLDPDRAAEIEESGLQALSLAAAAA